VVNVVQLTGTVRYVHVKPFPTYVIVSLKLELPNEQILWVQVKNVEKGNAELETIQNLKDKTIAIVGKLQSRSKDAAPPKYPKPRTFYDITTNPSGIKQIPVCIEGSAGNNVQLSGKVKEIKTSNRGVFFKLGLKFYNPKSQSRGEWLARVQCPKDFTEDMLVVNQEAVVVGQLDDVDGALVIATQVLDVAK
jgi:hypothetical protein